MAGTLRTPSKRDEGRRRAGGRAWNVRIDSTGALAMRQPAGALTADAAMPMPLKPPEPPRPPANRRCTIERFLIRPDRRMSLPSAPELPAAFEIVRLGPSRAEDYRAIRLAALQADPGAFGSTYEVEAARGLDHFVARLAGMAVFGAYRDGEIVGMAGLRREPGPRERHKGVLWGVFVEARVRGLGVGRALLDAVLAEAAEELAQLTLAVAGADQRVRDWYVRAGFEVYGVEPRALSVPGGFVDTVLMVRFLTSADSPGDTDTRRCATSQPN
ncbi:GNAT family N-acetyltransferase [Burkholderia gladioli pv. alliicola]|uniref:GNAT family N-acetyltransferase n=1 Tax=Burkholderia gladioli TaxID=28095 RepID=UPI003D818804